MEIVQTAIYLTPAFLLGLLIGYWIGYRNGARAMHSKIMKALGVPDGYRIDTVGYRKTNDL